MNTFLIVATILAGAVIGCKAGGGMSFDAGLHISNGNRDLSDMLEAKGKKSDNTAVYHSWYSLTAWLTKNSNFSNHFIFFSIRVNSIFTNLLHELDEKALYSCHLSISFLSPLFSLRSPRRRETALASGLQRAAPSGS